MPSEAVIPVEYDEVSKFSEGLAAVATNEKWGYINQSNEMVIAPQYRSADDFHEGLACVCETDNYACIDQTGEVAFRMRYGLYNDFSDGLNEFNGGYLDKTGEYVISISDYISGDENSWHSNMTDFHDGLALATIFKCRAESGYRHSSRAICIDTAGKIQFQLSGDGSYYVWDVPPFSDGLAGISLCDGYDEEDNAINKRGAYINEKGEIVIGPSTDIHKKAGGTAAKSGDASKTEG